MFGSCSLTAGRSYFESVLSNQFCDRLVIRAAIVYCTVTAALLNSLSCVVSQITANRIIQYSIGKKKYRLL